MHAFIRRVLADRYSAELAGAIRILYGGSVKPDNIAGLMRKEDVDGALVGGASLDAETFAEIVNYDR
jgi:triosephosphate isomerase (TIM)